MEEIVKSVIAGVGSTGILVGASKIKEESLLGLLYKDTLQPSVQAISKALGDTIEFCMTPLLLCKFGNEAAKLNLKKRLDDYAKKLHHISEEHLLSVNPQVGVPILDKLTYTTNDDIAELFLNLLANASSTLNVNFSHPAFISLIERMTPDEALIIRYLKGKQYIPSVSLSIREPNGHFAIVMNKNTGLLLDLSLQFYVNIPTYLDNLSSMGLIEYKDGYYNDDSEYDRLFDKYSYSEVEKKLTDGTEKRGIWEKHNYEITDFGHAFINAVIK